MVLAFQAQDVLSNRIPDFLLCQFSFVPSNKRGFRQDAFTFSAECSAWEKEGRDSDEMFPSTLYSALTFFSDSKSSQKSYGVPKMHMM
jgi:hypothetical protein